MGQQEIMDVLKNKWTTVNELSGLIGISTGNINFCLNKLLKLKEVKKRKILKSIKNKGQNQSFWVHEWKKI